jgi:alkylhydroperoxidase family enzyme
MSRVTPLAPEHWTEETRSLLGGTRQSVAEMEGRTATGDGGLLSILCTVAHHPTLLAPFLGFTATLALRGVLSRRDSELLALRAAWRCQSAFEWGHHTVFARQAGLSDDEIERIGRAEVDTWNARDRLLLRAADELCADQQLADGTFAALREELDDAQLVELPFVVGTYTMLSMVANATGVPLEPGLSELPPA